MNCDIHISRRLAALRALKGISQVELCEQTGIPIATYQCWEQDKYIPKVDGLITLADFYGVSVDTIVGREPIDCIK